MILYTHRRCLEVALGGLRRAHVSCPLPALKQTFASAGCGRSGELSECCLFDTTGNTPLRISRKACQARFAKIFLFPKFGKRDLTAPSRSQEGRFAIVTIRWRGMRWTRWVARRAARARTVKPCGPVSATLGSSCVKTIRAATVAKKPASPGRARSSRSNHCAGNAVMLRRPVVTTLVCFFHSAYEAAGAAERPAFPAPSVFGRDENDASPGRICAAGMLFDVLTGMPDFEVDGGRLSQSSANSETSRAARC
jgi:hypothetical protein